MFSEYDYNNTLCHYGVKGMKWGVRKEQRRNEYRNKLQKRATKKAKKHKEYADIDKYGYKDIEKKGISSSFWKEHVRSEYEDFNYNHNDGSTTDQVIGGLRALNYYLSNDARKEYVSELKLDYKREMQKAKEWTQRQENLMNYPVTKKTKKSELRDIYRGKQ